MNKKVVVSLSALVLFLAAPAWAQNDPPRYDIFAGYSYLRGDFGQQHGDLAGGGIVSGAFHLNSYLAAVAEFSTHHDTIGGVNVDNNLYLFGPRVYFLRTDRFTPFAHALLGFHHTQVGFPGAGIAGDDDTGTAFAAGVGLDVNIHKNLAFRALQVDYLLMDQNLPTGINQSTDNLRLASGIVFKWGEQ